MRGLTSLICSGSKRNWSSLCKALHRDMPGRPLYALDLRNHGASPHASPMTYEAMAGDVKKFIMDKGLKDVALLGHSMHVNFLSLLKIHSERNRRGGKVAMASALSLKAIPLSHLIVVDIAPSIGGLSPEFIQYIDIMKKIEALPPGVIKTRTDADHRLQPYESVLNPHCSVMAPELTIPSQDLSIRQFLLTNLKLPSHSRTAPHHAAQERATFNVPLGILSRSIEALGSFPYQYNTADQSAPTAWNGPTLVMKGTKSA